MEASQLTPGEAMTAGTHLSSQGTARSMAEQRLWQLHTDSLNAYLQLHGWQAIRRCWGGYWVWRIERIGEEKIT